jgi:hypothetical protein
MAKRPYFTLLERHEGQWGIEFGAYDRADVEGELQDRRDHDVKKKDLKIVKTKSARTADIEPIVAALNANPEGWAVAE